MLDLFFPLALFWLIMCLAGVIVASLALDSLGDVLLQARRGLGLWFALFAVILLALAVALSLGLRGISWQPDLPITPAEALPFKTIAWSLVFFVVNAFAAYVLLWIWSDEAHMEGDDLLRQLAFGRDRVAGDNISKVIEVAYWYSLGPDIGRWRTRSFFAILRRGRNPALRYALLRPADAEQEDEFRTLARYRFPFSRSGLPALPHWLWLFGDKGRPPRYN